MIAGFPLGFAQPLVLLGLLSLPVLWWLLRLVPPRPRQQRLGSEKLLLDILPKEETPARTPWWLTLLRLTLATLLILAAAGPLWNPPLATSQASAPLALLIDDGWAAAATWDTRVRTAEDLIARAETRRLDWLFSIHNTDRSAAELLLFLHGGMTVNKTGQIGRRA